VTYKLKDLLDEDIKGRFYGEELQLTKETDIAYIEKVLQERKVGRKKQYLVKWLGYPDKFNKWIDEKDLVSYGKV